MPVRIKRVYEPAAKSDGMRILVDRVWPRGISRADARLDQWNKDIAPTTQLRKWFGHKPGRWAEFQRRYRAELKGSAALAKLRRLVRARRVTLVYGAHDPDHNQAAALRSLLNASTRARKKRARPKAAKRKARKPAAQKA